MLKQNRRNKFDESKESQEEAIKVIDFALFRNIFIDMNVFTNDGKKRFKRTVDGELIVIDSTRMALSCRYEEVKDTLVIERINLKPNKTARTMKIDVPLI